MSFTGYPALGCLEGIFLPVWPGYKHTRLVWGGIVYFKDMVVTFRMFRFQAATHCGSWLVFLRDKVIFATI